MAVRSPAAITVGDDRAQVRELEPELFELSGAPERRGRS
jgi:hypothetical protein